jgi:hypothetical protein
MSDEVRAISLHQPWASLIAQGAKTIETRSWRTPYRGLLAIHAAKVVSRDLLVLAEPAAYDQATIDAVYRALKDPPRGAIVAVARLVKCLPTAPQGSPYVNLWVQRLSHQEVAFGDFRPGRWGWVLEDVRALSEPVPCRGQQGIWPLPADVWAEVEARIGAMR